MAKKNLKNLAISLRKDGLSYSDILKKVPVAKSTLSLWLRSVGLSQRQKQTLTERKLLAIKRGGLRKREQRLQKIKDINRVALDEIGTLDGRDLWLAGIMLYWAEGEKQKETNVSVGVRFSNSDAKMIKLFIKWIREFLLVEDNDIVFELYLHDNFRDHADDFVKYWSNQLSCPADKLSRVYFKKNKILTKRKNIGQLYHGQINVRIRKSTDLNRKIAGWVRAFNKQCGIV